jgi:hypothetical protein
MFAACGACRSRNAATANEASGAASGESSAASASARGGDAKGPAASPLAAKLWASAKDGEAEDLAALAAHEGAQGLVEAASDSDLRPTAIRAMGFARGYAQLPYLARAAAGNDDTEARLALDAAIDLAARPRTSEDPEDADELKAGCEGLDAVARDAARSRARRVAAVRALRMMPCPPTKSGELPTDVDSK